ncbi:MAG: YdcF family protein [Myxococcales bacterium]|nr:YdcF family protein [Myxococcales bacterium]
MFFFLSKTLDLLLDPWWWVFVPLGIGLAQTIRERQRSAVAWLVVGLVVFVTLSVPRVSNHLWHSLEANAVSTMRSDAPYDVVVLLGGAASAAGSTKEQPAWGDNVDRLTVTFDLLRTGRARNVIVSGGALADDLPSEAAFLSRQLASWGIEPARILVEDQARNTAENARYSKALIEQHQFRAVLVVTSAFHVERALGCFRAVGLETDVLPVDFRLRRPAEDAHWLPRASYLEQSGHALREWFGRLVYRASGRARDP